VIFLIRREQIRLRYLLRASGGPNLRRAQPIRVYAEVKAGEERVVISALAMEVR
jgi:hypothetical protein